MAQELMPFVNCYADANFTSLLDNSMTLLLERPAVRIDPGTLLPERVRP